MPGVGDRRRPARAGRARRSSGRACASRSPRSPGRRASGRRAIFSLVASAWKSTTTTFAPRARLLDELVERPRTGRPATSRKSQPSRLTTATGVPSAAGATASAAARASRTRRSPGGSRAPTARGRAPISSRAQTWLPSVTTSAPAASSLSASFGVSPRPSAAFSPLTTQKSAPSSSRSAGQPLLDAPRGPAAPKTSARKRMRNAGASSAAASGAAGCTSSVDVVARRPACSGRARAARRRRSRSRVPIFERARGDRSSRRSAPGRPAGA